MSTNTVLGQLDDLQPVLYCFALKHEGIVPGFSVEDLVQEALVFCLGKQHLYDPLRGAKFTTFCCRISLNHWRNQRNAWRRRGCGSVAGKVELTELLEAVHLPRLREDSRLSPRAQYWLDRCRELEDLLLERYPEGLRVVRALREEQGDVAATAQVLGWSERRVNNVLGGVRTVAYHAGEHFQLNHGEAAGTV